MEIIYYQSLSFLAIKFQLSQKVVFSSEERERKREFCSLLIHTLPSSGQPVNYTLATTRLLVSRGGSILPYNHWFSTSVSEICSSDWSELQISHFSDSYYKKNLFQDKEVFSVSQRECQ